MQAKQQNQLVGRFGILEGDIQCNGAFFSEFDGVKKGEVIIGDYNPAVGTTITLNGKQLGQPLPDVAFYNAILRIWIGANPADSTLKPQLLGEKE